MHGTLFTIICLERKPSSSNIFFIFDVTHHLALYALAISQYLKKLRHLVLFLNPINHVLVQKNSFIGPVLVLEALKTRSSNNSFRKYLTHWHSHQLLLLYYSIFSMILQRKLLNLEIPFTICALLISSLLLKNVTISLHFFHFLAWKLYLS